MSIDEKIADTARAINRQTEDFADARARLTRNIVILEDGRIHTIENPMYLQNKVDDCESVLKDMLRYLDELIKERDGVGD